MKTRKPDNESLSRLFIPAPAMHGAAALALAGVGEHEAHVADELGVGFDFLRGEEHAGGVAGDLAEVVHRDGVAVEDGGEGVVLAFKSSGLVRCEIDDFDRCFCGVETQGGVLDEFLFGHRNLGLREGGG